MAGKVFRMSVLEVLSVGSWSSLISQEFLFLPSTISYQLSRGYSPHEFVTIHFDIHKLSLFKRASLKHSFALNLQRLCNALLGLANPNIAVLRTAPGIFPRASTINSHAIYNFDSIQNLSLLITVMRCPCSTWEA